MRIFGPLEYPRTQVFWHTWFQVGAAAVRLLAFLQERRRAIIAYIEDNPVSELSSASVARPGLPIP